MRVSDRSAQLDLNCGGLGYMLINGSFSGCWARICSYAVVHPSLNYSLGFLILSIL